MRHLTWDEVWAYAQGDEVRAEKPEPAAAHVTGCSLCSQRVRTVTKANQAVIRSFQSRVPTATPEHTTQLMERLRSMQIPKPVAKLRSRRPLARALTIATAAAAIICAAVGMQTHMRAERQNGSSAGPAAISYGPAQSGTTTRSSITASSMQTQKAATPVTGVRTEDSTITTVARVNGIDQVSVRDSRGQPVGGANVAFVAAGQVERIVHTENSGVTTGIALNAPVDPKRAVVPSTAPAQGTVILVVWKPGYQPVVVYNVAVFMGGTPYCQNVTLTPVQTAQTPVQAIDGNTGQAARSGDDAIALFKLAQSFASTNPGRHSALNGDG